MVSFCISTAKHIMHTRSLRRQLGVRVLVVLMILFSLGVFFIGDWLERHPWPFVIFWAVVFVLTSFLMFLGAYDALRVIKEVQDEHNKEIADGLRELAEHIREEERQRKKADND